MSNLLKRFRMVGTRYFASATNYWYSIWYYNYGRTWSITSLPGLVFRRRREVFIHSTNDRCEAQASLKGCFLCFCFSPPVFFHWTVESVWGFLMIYTHSRKALDISIQRLVAHRGVEPLLQEWKSWVLADIRMRHSLATQRELKSQRLSVVT